MKTFREYISQPKVATEQINESKIDLSRTKYGNFWGDILGIIGDEAVGVPGSEKLESFLTRVLQHAADLELDHLYDNADDIDEDSYTSIKRRAMNLSDAKIKIV